MEDSDVVLEAECWMWCNPMSKFFSFILVLFFYIYLFYLFDKVVAPEVGLKLQKAQNPCSRSHQVLPKNVFKEVQQCDIKATSWK